MLIEFRVANYISIGEEQVLSLVPAPKQKEHYENIIQSTFITDYIIPFIVAG